MDVESGLFRMVDEALAGFLSSGPERVSIRLDWSEQLEADLQTWDEPGDERTTVPPAGRPDAPADQAPQPRTELLLVADLVDLPGTA